MHRLGLGLVNTNMDNLSLEGPPSWNHDLSFYQPSKFSLQPHHSKKQLPFLKLTATAPGNRVKLKMEINLPTINSHGQAVRSVSLRQGKQKTCCLSGFEGIPQEKIATEGNQQLTPTPLNVAHMSGRSGQNCSMGPGG